MCIGSWGRKSQGVEFVHLCDTRHVNPMFQIPPVTAVNSKAVADAKTMSLFGRVVYPVAGVEDKSRGEDLVENIEYLKRNKR